MDEKTRRQLEVRARIVKSLAHPARLFVVQTLLEGERCVCELTELIGSDISTVSKHLALLKNAGIIQDEKRGNKIFYKLRTPCLVNFLQCVERVIDESRQDYMEIV